MKIALLLLLFLSVSWQALATETQNLANRQLLVTVKNPPQREAAVFKSFKRGYVNRQRYSSAVQARRQAKAIANDYALADQGGWQINAISVYCALLEVPPDMPLDEIIGRLKQDPRVESVQPLMDYSVLNNSLPNKSYNDPYFKVQFQQQTNVISDIHRQATGRGVSIAIIDTGADVQHPDLNGQISYTRNFVDDDQQQFQQDIHGTAVAGIITAKPDNQLGIVGLAPDADVAVLKACWQLEAQGSAAKCNSFTLANAISHAIDNRVDILNMSLSGPQDALITRLVEAAIEQGILVVASDPVVGDHRYPALLPGVIRARQIADDSATTNSVIINGKDVLSTGPGGGFDFFSGSSMSAAAVTAYSALLLEKDQHWKSEALIELLSKVYTLSEIE